MICDLSDCNLIVVPGAASCCGGAGLSIYCRYICYNLHDLQQTLVSTGPIRGPDCVHSANEKAALVGKMCLQTLGGVVFLSRPVSWSLVPEPGPLTLCNKRERSSGTQTRNFNTNFLTWQDDILILLISVKIKPPEALVTLVIIDDYVQLGGTSVQSLPSTVQTTVSAQLCCLQPSVRPWSFIIML